MELVHDADGGDQALVGDVAHIVARSDDGPRADPGMPQEERDAYPNLVLLCKNHHAVIDQEPGEYSVGRLHKIKDDHERWVRESLTGYDAAAQHDKERYAAIVEGWATGCNLEGWRIWTSHILTPDPTMRVEQFDALNSLGTWLLGRIWPHRYPALEDAFDNFRMIAQDFLHQFAQHWHETNGIYYIERFYRIPEWNDERYNALLAEFTDYLTLLHDLLLELTRAANRVCDEVRASIDAGYRLVEGVLLVEYTASIVEPLNIVRTEYRNDERNEGAPYRGLEHFRQDRFGRDLHFAMEPDTNDENDEA